MTCVKKRRSLVWSEDHKSKGPGLPKFKTLIFQPFGDYSSNVEIHFTEKTWYLSLKLENPSGLNYFSNFLTIKPRQALKLIRASRWNMRLKWERGSGLSDTLLKLLVDDEVLCVDHENYFSHNCNCI